MATTHRHFDLVVSTALGFLVAACTQPAGADGADAGVAEVPRRPDGSAICPALFDGLEEGNEAILTALFDPTRVADIAITLDEEGLTELRQDPQRRVVASATISVGGDEVFAGEIGVSVKGTDAFQPIDERPSLKLDFDFAVCGLFAGLEQLTLNNQVLDPSRVRDVVGYTAFREAGLPASRVGYTHLAINGASRGLYVALEAVGSAFVARNFASTSHVYEEDHDDPLNMVGSPEGAEWVQVELGDDDKADLIAVQTAIRDAPFGEGFMNALAPFVDWDRLLRFAVVEAWLQHADGYSRRATNALLHFDAEGRVTPLPSALDEILEPYGGEFLFGARVVLLSGCYADPMCRARLHEAIADTTAALDAADLPGVVDDAAAAVDQILRLDLTSAGFAGAVADRVLVLDRLAIRSPTLRALATCDADALADEDGDGFDCTTDCRLLDPLFHPGAEDVCGNGLDEDCNSVADDGQCP